MGTKKKTSRTLSPKQLKDVEYIEQACQIEACQSAIFPVIKRLVNEFGKEIVGESLGWFHRLLKPSHAEVTHETEA